jgi:hypothetical protein
VPNFVQKALQLLLALLFVAADWATENVENTAIPANISPHEMIASLMVLALFIFFSSFI